MDAPQIITIGRAADNILVLNDPKVSIYHATATFLQDGAVVLEDRSTNGTYVDGQRIQQILITPKNQIRLANVIPLPYDMLVQARQKKKSEAEQVEVKRDHLDFRADFKKLEQVQQNYRANQERIKDTYNKNQNLLRGAFFIPAAGGALMMGLNIGSPDVGRSLMMSGGAAGGIGALLVTSMLNPAKKLAALEAAWKESFVCPNPACRRPLYRQEYAELAAQKQCSLPHCKARWAD